MSADKLDEIAISVKPPTAYQGDVIKWRGITLYWHPELGYVSVPGPEDDET